VLPAPSGPIMPKISPLFTRKLMPRTACVGPYDLCRSLTMMAGDELFCCITRDLCGPLRASALHAPFYAEPAEGGRVISVSFETAIRFPRPVFLHRQACRVL